MYNKQEKVFVETKINENCCNSDSFGNICVHCNLCRKSKNSYTGSEEITFLKAKKYLHNL